MSSPVRSKRRLTLAREFHNSVKAGPRVWLIAATAFVCLLGLPMLGRVVSLLATVAVGVGLLFIAPVIISAVASGVLAYLRQRMVVRVFTANGGATAPAARSSRVPVEEGRSIRQAEVIEVKTINTP